MVNFYLKSGLDPETANLCYDYWQISFEENSWLFTEEMLTLKFHKDINEIEKAILQNCKSNISCCFCGDEISINDRNTIPQNEDGALQFELHCESCYTLRQARAKMLFSKPLIGKHTARGAYFDQLRDQVPYVSVGTHLAAVFDLKKVIEYLGVADLDYLSEIFWRTRFSFVVCDESNKPRIVVDYEDDVYSIKPSITLFKTKLILNSDLKYFRIPEEREALQSYINFIFHNKPIEESFRTKTRISERVFYGEKDETSL